MNVQPMIDIFFDLSTTATGYAVYQDGVYAASGTLFLDPKKERDTERRAFHMVRRMHELFLCYHPQFVHAERLPCLTHRGQEVSTYLHGGFKFLAMSHSVAYETKQTPSHWRKVLGFNQTKGQTTKQLKEQSVRYACSITGKEITDDNEADAVCIGAAYFMEHNTREGTYGTI